MQKKAAYLEITIIDGNLVAEGFNFEGKGCHELEEVFADALGTTEELRKKPDYFSGGDGGRLPTARRV